MLKKLASTLIVFAAVAASVGAFYLRGEAAQFSPRF